MLSLCIHWTVCLTHLFRLSLVLWCAGSADKQRCETLSAQGNLLRMKLLPFLCQLGAHGEDGGREVVRGTNSSRLYGSPLVGAQGCWGTKRPGTFKVSCGTFPSISSVYRPDIFFLYELKACRMLAVSLCFWLLPPDRLIFGVCFVFRAKAEAYMPALCTVSTQ